MGFWGGTSEDWNKIKRSAFRVNYPKRFGRFLTEYLHFTAIFQKKLRGHEPNPEASLHLISLHGQLSQRAPTKVDSETG